MKVLIVSTCFEENPLINEINPNESYPEFNKETTYAESYPLGLGYLYAYIKEKGYEVDLLHLNYYPEEECYYEVMKRVNDFKPDVICYQMLTSNRVSTRNSMRQIHARFPEIKIVLGGIHPTILYEQTINRYHYSFIVLGEGEETLIELLKEFKRKKPNYSKIKGLVYWDRNMVMTPQRKLIEDLDSLPFPAHDLFINEKVTRAGILTSRGCPFKCSFCCINPLTQRKVRFRSLDNVILEIKYLIKTFPWLKEIWFFDDSLFLNNARVIELCKRLIELNTDIEFTCCGRAKPISKEMVEWLEKANFKTVLLGVETGSEEVLKKTNKGITKEDVLDAYNKFKKSNIAIKPFHIIGLPGENKRTAIESAEFFRELHKIKYDYAGSSANYLRVYPGTLVYEIAKQRSWINDNYWETDEPCPHYTSENSKEKIYEFGEIFLNHVSLNRFFTWNGFQKQWIMIPYIIPYLFKKVTKLILKRLR